MGNLDDFKICNLASYRTDLNRRATLLMRAYWEEIRDGRDLPYRDDVDPREIGSALEHSFIIERTGPDDIRFRLAGMCLNDLLGMEVRGMPLRTLIDGNDRQRFDQDVGALFSGPEIQCYQLASARSYAPRVDAELLLLPLKDRRDAVTRAIGCLISNAGTDILENRFTLVERSSTPIDIFGPAHAERVRYTGTSIQIPSPPPKPEKSGTSHLRLVKG